MKRKSADTRKRHSSQAWITLVAVLLLCGVVLLVEDQYVSAADGDEVVAPTVTFTNPTPITIPNVPTGQANANPYPSSINVSGIAGNIPSTPTAVRVTINNFSHTYASDVGMVLVGPTGAALQLQLCVTDFDNGTNQPPTTYSISDAGTARMPGRRPARGRNNLPANGFLYRC